MESHGAPSSHVSNDGLGDLPLQGLKVLELGDFVSGPYCARLLADAGAEVIKVEAPEGDRARRIGPFPDDLPDPNQSGLFLYLNANKLGITLNLRSSEGRCLLAALLKDADVLVENGPPRNMEDLGLDFSSLREAHPRLIVTSVTPFGQTGPYRDYLGDDLIGINMGALAYASPGLPDAVADPEREPPLKPATYLADFTAGVTGAVATMLALLARDWDGAGRHVDVSEQEAVASGTLYDLSAASYLGMVKRRGAPLAGLMPNCYLPCKDGYVVLVAFLEPHWRALIEVMDNPDWADNELFKDGMLRSDNWDALRLLLLDWTMAHTGQEIYEVTQARGVPCIPAYEISEVLASEHLVARNFLVEAEVAPGRTAQFPGSPYRFDGVPWPLRMRAPRLGEHTSSLLSERLGYSALQLTQLMSSGAF